MYMEFDHPRVREDRDGDQDGADVCDGQAELGFRLIVVLAGEAIEDHINSWYEEADRHEETEAGPKIHKSDLKDGKTVVLPVDGLELREEAVGYSENEGLVACHCEDDGLGEKNFQRSLNGLFDFGGEGGGVFAIKVVGSSFLLFELLLACSKEGWDVAFVEEKYRTYGGNGADDEEDPEEPWPVKVFEDDATKEGTYCWA